jgi:peptide/nickel transport system permease protein
MKKGFAFWLALLVLLGIHAAVFLAAFVSAYDPTEQDREFPFAPPTRIHFVDRDGRFHLRPFVYGVKPVPDGFSEYVEDSSTLYPIRFFGHGAPYRLAGILNSDLHLFGVEAPGRLYLLGTDGFGRDLFSRLAYGGRISLLAGLFAALLASSAGLLAGALAGYYGKWADAVLMRLAELFLALPWLYLLFAVRAFLPLHVSALGTFFLIVAVVGLVGWARPARLIRGVVLSAKERNYVLAARGFGASDPYLLRRHVLPNAYGVFLTQLAVLIPQYVLAEVVFSFLGLGVSEPTPSWGNMMGTLQQYHVLATYWWMLSPAVILVPVVWGYYVLADTMQRQVKSSL